MYERARSRRWEVEHAGLRQAALRGFSLKPPKWVRKAVSTVAKAAPVLGVVAGAVPGLGIGIAAAKAAAGALSKQAAPAVSAVKGAIAAFEVGAAAGQAGTTTAAAAGDAVAGQASVNAGSLVKVAGVGLVGWFALKALSGGGRRRRYGRRY